MNSVHSYWRQTARSSLVAILAVALFGLDRAAAEDDGGAMPNSKPRIVLPQGPSENWAGYVVESNLLLPASGAVGDVQGQWRVPALTCGASNAYSSAWVGIDGYANSTVEQVGTQHSCINGKPVYAAWYEMYPAPRTRVALKVNPGDLISGEVRYVGGSSFVLSLQNQTTGQSFSTTQQGQAQRQSAEWVVEAPYSGGVLPLANFGTVQFSGANTTINGHTGGISDLAWQNNLIVMDSSSLVLKAQPSTLSNGGSAFSVTWFHQ